MPATRSLKSDTITQLLHKLPAKYKTQISSNNNIKQQIITKTRESLRIIESKFPRQVLCKGDSSEARSAVILEYVLRQGIQLEDGKTSQSIRVPLDELGKIIGARKKDIERVGKAVSVLLIHGLESSTGERKTVNKSSIIDRKRKRNSMSSERNNNNHTDTSENVTRKAAKRDLLLSSKILKQSHQRQYSATTGRMEIITSASTSTLKPTSTSILTSSRQASALTAAFNIEPQHMHNLSMKLQAYLHDPNQIEIKSKELFQQYTTYKYKNESTKYTRNAVMFDIQSNIKIYEGACFYIIVKEMEQGGCDHDDHNSYNHRINIHNEEHDFEKELTMDDIVRELRIDHKSFSDILQEVQNVRKEISRGCSITEGRDVSSLQNKSNASKSRNVASKVTRSIVKAKEGPTSRKNGKSTKINFLSTRDSLHDSDDDSGNDNDDKDNNGSGKCKDNQNEFDSFMLSQSKVKYISKDLFESWKNEKMNEVTMTQSHEHNQIVKNPLLLDIDTFKAISVAASSVLKRHRLQEIDNTL